MIIIRKKFSVIPNSGINTNSSIKNISLLGSKYEQLMLDKKNAELFGIGAISIPKKI